MQNRFEFLTLRRLCREHGFGQKLFVTRLNKAGKLVTRKVKSRTERVFDEGMGEYVRARIPAPISSRHYIHLDERCVVHCARSNNERTKSLEAFIEFIQRHSDVLPETVSLLRSMRGVRRGSDIHWYCEDELVPDNAFELSTYLQEVSDTLLMAV